MHLVKEYDDHTGRSRYQDWSIGDEKLITLIFTDDQRIGVNVRFGKADVSDGIRKFLEFRLGVELPGGYGIDWAYFEVPHDRLDEAMAEVNKRFGE